MELWFIFSVIGYMIGAVSGILDKYMMNQRYHPVTTGTSAHPVQRPYPRRHRTSIPQPSHHSVAAASRSNPRLPPRGQLRRIPARATK